MEKSFILSSLKESDKAMLKNIQHDSAAGL
jgi:hypothetical protein